MIIVWGKRLYGRIDRVPGVMYVATTFGHLYYFPSIPLESYIVVEPQQRGEKPRYIPIQRDIKSVVYAYLRSVFSVVGFLLALYGGVKILLDGATYGTPTSDLMIDGCFALLGIAFLVGAWVSVRMSVADQRRAFELAKLAQVPLELVYNKFR
ncbi:MAG TPA: hypothetical protein VFC63_08775 [Blastocatellia bacterium]|nr:hypothetical protein [Blastocatellia bacterium]